MQMFICPHKPLAVTSKLDVPYDNECQIWNQHPNVNKNSLSHPRIKRFLLTCVMQFKQLEMEF